MASPDSPVYLLLASAIASTVMLLQLARRRVADRHREAARTGHETTLRLLRLAVTDQRNLALTLFGHAQATQPPDPALTGLARRLLDLSEDLARQTDQPNIPRHLQDEDIRLLPVVEFAMAQVAGHLGPGRRAWRLSPGLDPVCLRADRRAINQVLVNVLSGAAAATRNGDRIEISTERTPDGLCLIVQDEGIGLPSAANASEADGRGIGLGLTLARFLMQAHGGALGVETAEQIGTRVRLSFPAARIV